MTERRMHLNFHGNWAGEHFPAWGAERQADPVAFRMQYYTRLAQTAERGLFDGVFYAAGLAVHESQGRPATPGIDPVVMAGALAAQTEYIGLAVTISTTFNEPYNVARAIASLDHVSGGRGAWNVVTTYDPSAAKNFGMTDLPPKSERYNRAREFVEIVLGLWESWEPEAFVREDGRVVAIDSSRIHPIDHVGPYFRVRGPAQTPRSLQGRPVLFQAGASEEGKAFAAAVADGIFSVALELEGGRAFYREMKGRVADAGRDPACVRILPGVYLYIGSSEAEARRALAADSTPQDALDQLALRLSIPADRLALDETIAMDVLDHAARNPMSHGHTMNVIGLFRRERLTIREFLERQPVRGPHRVLVGPPEVVAASLVEWFTEGAADGFNIGNLTQAGLEVFVDHVVPILQRQGLYRREYEGRTLRANFMS